MLRLSASVLLAAALAACGGDAPAPAGDAPAGSPDAAPAVAPAADAPRPAAGRWSGEVTGGYKGNQIMFGVSPDGGQISGIAFQGHWDCSDGIEMTTSGPEGAYPVTAGRVKVSSVEPPDGGATAIRFEMEGQMGAASASGTLRINLNALGCDTRVLTWTAAPDA